MDFALSDEQQALADAERAWLAKNDPIAARRPGIDDGPARLSPSDLLHLTESGLSTLLTREMGGTHVDLAVLVEEHGRAGSPIPVAELAVATRLLEQLAHPALDRVAAGSATILPTLASVESPALHARIDGPTLHLTGTSAPATGLIDADLIVVVAHTDAGDELAAVVPVAEVTIRSLATLDLTRSWAVADIDLVLGEGHWSALPPGSVAFVRDQLATFRSVDALGAAAGLLDMTVEYAGSRTQFDRPIASFQAVKHHCANMVTAVESARAVLWAAAVALDGDDAQARARAVSAAAAYAGDRSSAGAQTALQVHGGIGFTWEHDVHLHIRRIKVDELLDGSVSYHRRRLVTA